MTISDLDTIISKADTAKHARPLGGAGLGFRRELMSEMDKADLTGIDFFEVSPENWLNTNGQIGGQYYNKLRAYTEQYPFVCHGLSLSIGSTAPLDTALLHNIKDFMRTHDIGLYTEHLSWCSDQAGHLYDLLPIPCTEEAVHWVADRIKQAQDILGQQIGFENASYYFKPELYGITTQMSDSQFITAVAEESDCLLHLDVNNIYVNSQNFGFDAHKYLRQLPLERTCYLHVAGHHTENDGLIVDTHGNKVIDPVWSLLSDAYSLIIERTNKPANLLPTCLERDFNFPSINELINEVTHIRSLQFQADSVRTGIANDQDVAVCNHRTYAHDLIY
ncbi:DUF692 domain-containing protein [Psychrobacter sp.]|uniref:HvfB family MNIO-type RiPP peptide maturase n=1 Tax=Psychrobacter sp. TaxID=56811 RepID=UPI0025D82952|nr:DUF692 domain-containing protein [Psychrobacter sp.]